MEWTRPSGAVERLIDLVVPVVVAAAAGFAAWAGSGLSWLAASGAVAGAVVAVAALRSAAGGEGGRLAFDVADIGAGAETADDDDVLLLRDRLVAPREDSRVVRLFAPDSAALPGELAARIDDWLEGARARTAARGAVDSGGGHGPAASPASAALHAALAGIRQSLR